MAEKYKQNLIARFQEDVEERKQNQGVAPQDGVIDVVGVDLNIRSNAKLHHTNEYEQTLSSPKQLIVRRGAPFLLKLIFDRAFDPAKDEIALEFSFGSKPSLEHKTVVFLRVEGNDKELKTNQWGAKIKEFPKKDTGNQVAVEISASVDAKVGEWRMKVHTGFKKDEAHKNYYLAYTHPDFIFILFNPWCPDDQVFVEKEEYLKEYVLNEVGVAAWGSEDPYTTAVPIIKWLFGQFEDVSLYTALSALRSTDMLDSDRGNPILVGRQLAELGWQVMVGLWCYEPGCYSGGTPPGSWTGSVAILEEYMKTQEPVKFAQCWVFAGVLCTLLRSMGIPSRCVTNIHSPTDADRSLTYDVEYVKQPGCESVPKYSSMSESGWNFHVWNEMWSKRPELKGYNGWQALDGTYGTGPCPVRAVLKGDVNIKHDTTTVFGEVNADEVVWFYESDPSSPLGRKLLSCRVADTNWAGKALITSRPGSHDTAKFVTETYKPKEGTEEERVHYRRAIQERHAKDRHEILQLYGLDKKTWVDDVDFKFDVPGNIKFGEDIQSMLRMKVTGKEKRVINYNVKTVISTNSNWILHTLGEVSKCGQQLDAGQTFTVSIPIKSSDYELKLGYQKYIRFEVFAWVDDTNQFFNLRHRVLVMPPQLLLSIAKQGDEENDDVYLNTTVKIQIQFTNPTSHTLTSVSVKIGGNGIIKGQEVVKTPKTINAGATMVEHHMVTPKKKGKHTLIAVFDSDQLGGIQGSNEINVLEKKEEDDEFAYL